MGRGRGTPKRARYVVRNWPAYDRALVRRGDLTIWIAPETLETWRAPGRRTYSDAAIEAALTVRAVYRLALRQTEGLVGSIFRMLEIAIPVPDHTTLSRRGRRLAIDRHVDAGEGVDLVIDSTGLRLYRRGSWLRRKQAGRRMPWRKLHITIDPRTGRILSEKLTRSGVHDSKAVPALLARIDGRIGRVYGDGAYDGSPTYQVLIDRRQALPIPQGVFRPRSPAVRAADSLDPLSQRGRHARFIAQHGRSGWEKATGYGCRNLVEATFSRLKRSFGDRLHGRSLPAQKVEAAILAQALNRMAEIGMPVTERVA
ncbi:IS5 family transposase [Mycobacterium sp. KBS0706]|uniref:IS5 family transposase n=1 Tax=Mycobacterium sp. KBS0706 TaxID=2578109 RepID=UPI00110FF257|nr:IS5 family transposase [Mycobacterium sp. KBS0706]TSD82583.1 IS5 family transposase [Mycobacterium sp. KBS0706]